MCEMLSDVIESEKAILPQVLLSDDQFTVDMGYKMFDPPVAPPPDAPIEMPTPDVFTIAQVSIFRCRKLASFGLQSSLEQFD